MRPLVMHIKDELRLYREAWHLGLSFVYIDTLMLLAESLGKPILVNYFRLANIVMAWVLQSVREDSGEV